MSIPNDLKMYRKMMHIKYKYSTLLELDNNKRRKYKLLHFFKKHYLITPLNMSYEEYKYIPSIYRYRCYIYDSEELSNIKYMHELLVQEYSNYEEQTSDALIDIANIEYSEKYNISKLTANKIPIMIDLRIYGETPTLEINFNDTTYYLDSNTQQHIIKLYEKIKPDSISAERFEQMIEWSKALCNMYK